MPEKSSETTTWLLRALVALLIGIGGWWCNRVNTQLDTLTQEATRIRCALEVQAGGNCF